MGEEPGREGSLGGRGAWVGEEPGRERSLGGRGAWGARVNCMYFCVGRKTGFDCTMSSLVWLSVPDFVLQLWR